MNTNDVVKHYGSRAKIAEELNMHPTAVSHWGKRPPDLRQFQIQVLTDGKLLADRVLLRCGRGRKKMPLDASKVAQ